MTALVLVAASTAAAAQIGRIPVIVENPSKEGAAKAPVSAGIPLERGAVKDMSALSLTGPDGKPVAAQARCLSRWPDGSCRWALIDFQATVKAGARAEFALSTGGAPAAPDNPVKVTNDAKAVTFENGILRFAVARGGELGTLSSTDGKAGAGIVSLVEIGPRDKRITSKVVVDSVDVYAEGPVRAAAAVYGRRLYSDGMEGPFSQRIEMFAGSPYVRVEDTFVYAHFPGTHANPQNPLGLWKLEVRPTGDAKRCVIAPFIYSEEAEGLVVSESGVAFWGLDKPFDLSRHTDKELIGEDTPGIALGVGKSCAALAGILPAGGSDAAMVKPVLGLYAHTTPEVYAGSGALGDFAAAEVGKFEAVEEGMRQILGFWLWYQDNDPRGSFDKGPWHGLFDWGDWQTRFADRRHQPTGWNYLEGRYGWDCNEMDTTLMLWSAFCHTGRPEYWRAAAAMSRHTMDVDMINVDYRKYKLPDYVYDPHSYGAPWKEGQDRLKTINTIGLGRRHNVQHWGNGVGDTRHTWNGGVMMYYYLTGNRRAYDAARAMADMHMQRIWGYANGEYTLSMWCLNNAWELTGEAKYFDEFKYRLGVIYRLRFPDGSIPEHIDFDKQAGYPEVDGQHGGGYLDLSLDYISNALIDHYADTGDKTAREVALGIAKAYMRYEPGGPADYMSVDGLRILGWAYKETGDQKFLERAKYHLSSLEARLLGKRPADARELLEKTDAVLRPFEWDIRVVGPAVRMAPYAMKAVADSGKNGK